MPQVSSEDIRRVCGPLPDRKIKEILECNAELEELVEATAWASGDNEHTPMRHLPPESPAAKIYDILVAGEEFGDERRGIPES